MTFFRIPSPYFAPAKSRRFQKLTFETLEPREMLATYAHLDPGGPAQLEETVPVNFVFVGYEQNQIDLNAFLAALPEEYDPIVRIPSFYGIEEKTGLEFDFEYDVTFTDDAFEDKFFAALTQLATPDGDVTLPQFLYNAINSSPLLTIPENYSIDAPSVEKWLAKHGPTGVDTTRDTVFFVNWWGRDDFLFHTYTKRGEADPDTGFEFSDTGTRGLIAWGGTPADDEETGLGKLGTHRIWFHDLSAGPDYVTGGFALDEFPDLDGDGLEDYRLPPVWEYLSGNWNADLTHDLGLIARYVAIDLLFTPSPLYSPSLTPDRLPDVINLDVNTYEGIQGVDASKEYLRPKMLLEEIRDLYPLPVTADHQNLDYSGEARDSFVGAFTGVVTHEDDGNVISNANLFFDAVSKLDDLLDGPVNGHGKQVYEAVAINYAVPPEDDLSFFLGVADDNWQNGVQSFVFSVLSPGIIDAGYGLTTTLIHEYGHHLGLSHVHDGYDPDLPGDFAPGSFGAAGEFFFAWAGNEVNSMMSYINLNWDFSQFDRDNMNRYLAAAHVQAANQVAEAVLAETDHSGRQRRQVERNLKAADKLIGQSQKALSHHHYEATFWFARTAYESVLSAAKHGGVEVVASNEGRELPDWATGGGGFGRNLAGNIHIDDHGRQDNSRLQMMASLLEAHLAETPVQGIENGESNLGERIEAFVLNFIGQGRLSHAEYQVSGPQFDRQGTNDERVARAEAIDSVWQNYGVRTTNERLLYGKRACAEVSDIALELAELVDETWLSPFSA